MKIERLPDSRTDQIHDLFNAGLITGAEAGELMGLTTPSYVVVPDDSDDADALRRLVAMHAGTEGYAGVMDLRAELAREELAAAGTDVSAWTDGDLAAHYDAVIHPREVERRVAGFRRALEPQ